MDCKKALTEAGGDFKKAEKILKELGLAAAAKRGGRATNEGKIFSKLVSGKAGLLELSCETDFVARNQDFIKLGNEIVTQVVEKGAAITAPEIQTKVADLIGTIKENMSIRRAEVLTAGPNETLVEYLHGEGRIGVIVKAKTDKAELLSNDKVKAFVFDCALHIAAFNPFFLAEKDIDADYLKEQEEIFTKQAASLGKPANVLQGIVKGKIKKHLSEIGFLDQPFVKDDKRSVAKVAQDLGKEVGGSVSIEKFLYFRVGEELKK